MITWTSRTAGAALLLIGLSGCDTLPGSDAAPVALSQARMALGAVTLVPPRGYCIDKSSLRQNFAMMARCDRLGVPSRAGDAPVGIIIASFSASQGSLPRPVDTAAALKLGGVTDLVETEAGITFRATGAPPAEGLAKQHWRGTSLIGTQVMGLALYGPQDGRAIGSDGRQLLSSVMTASKPGS